MRKSIIILLVVSHTAQNECRPVGTNTETVMKVDPSMNDPTAQLASHLDNEDSVDPLWTDFRKQYYPDQDSYWEDFNLRLNDTNKPLDLYSDLVKLLIDTNQQGITGTIQEFATTLPPAPMRQSVRSQHVRNPEVLAWKSK